MQQLLLQLLQRCNDTGSCSIDDTTAASASAATSTAAAGAAGAAGGDDGQHSPYTAK